MPTKPKPISRPWEQQKETGAQQRRVASNSQFYNSHQWRRLRQSYLSQHPLCECDECKILPVPLPAQMVDHVTPINQGGEPLDWSNLQAMNNRCHNKKSARESHGIYQTK